MADATTDEPVCAQVCVLKKIQETNVNVKEQRVGESRLREIDSVCVCLFPPSCMRVNRRPVLSPLSSAKVCLFFHLEGGRQICHENTRHTA